MSGKTSSARPSPRGLAAPRSRTSAGRLDGGRTALRAGLAVSPDKPLRGDLVQLDRPSRGVAAARVCTEPAARAQQAAAPTVGLPDASRGAAGVRTRDAARGRGSASRAHEDRVGRGFDAPREPGRSCPASRQRVPRPGRARCSASRTVVRHHGAAGSAGVEKPPVSIT